MTARAARRRTAWVALLATLAVAGRGWAQTVAERDESHESELDSPERYALPALPPPLERLPLRGGVELGLGVRAGASGMARLVLTYGLFFEYIATDRLALGLHVDYLGVDRAAPTATDARGGAALAPTATLRWMPTTPRTMDGWRYGLRAGVGYRVIGGEADHLVIDATALVAVARVGVGVRYQRGWSSDSVARDAVFLVTERMSRTFSRSTRRRSKPVRVGLGMHALTGWVTGKGLGLMPLGMRVDLPVSIGDAQAVLPTVAWELLWFPGLDAPRSALQTISVGVLHHQRRGPWGVGASVGYGLASGAPPRAIGSGPVAAASVYYLLDNPGLFMGLHARTGMDRDNREAHGLLVSIGGVQIFR